VDFWSGFGREPTISSAAQAKEKFAMTFVTILLLIIGVIVVMAAAFLGISFLAGTHFYSRECARAGSAGTDDPCAQCNTDRDWYEGLPLWKQNLTAAWWWANRVACATKGCR
jgi:hypothetical protein